MFVKVKLVGSIYMQTWIRNFHRSIALFLNLCCRSSSEGNFRKPLLLDHPDHHYYWVHQLQNCWIHHLEYPIQRLAPIAIHLQVQDQWLVNHLSMVVRGGLKKEKSIIISRHPQTPHQKRRWLTWCDTRFLVWYWYKRRDKLIGYIGQNYCKVPTSISTILTVNPCIYPRFRNFFIDVTLLPCVLILLIKGLLQ